MGEDRRQGDRRQSPVGDRRGTETTSTQSEGLAKKTISLQTFIVIMAIVAVVIIGILWFVINNARNNDEYIDDETVYEDTDTSDDDTEYTEDVEDTEDAETEENVVVNTTENTVENTTENVAQ